METASRALYFAPISFFSIFVGQVGRIIGKGEANVRELQRLTGAVIKFPSAATENSSGNANSSPPASGNTSVHITGSFYSVQVSFRSCKC